MHVQNQKKLISHFSGKLVKQPWKANGSKTVKPQNLRYQDVQEYSKRQKSYTCQYNSSNKHILAEMTIWLDNLYRKDSCRTIFINNESNKYKFK